MLKYPKHLALVIAQAASALEQGDGNSTLFRNLFSDLLKKPPYKSKSIVTCKKKNRKILLLSTWSAGIKTKLILNIFMA